VSRVLGSAYWTFISLARRTKHANLGAGQRRGRDAAGDRCRRGHIDVLDYTNGGHTIRKAASKRSV
jgi:hypothetical protein